MWSFTSILFPVIIFDESRNPPEYLRYVALLFTDWLSKNTVISDVEKGCRIYWHGTWDMGHGTVMPWSTSQSVIFISFSAEAFIPQTNHYRTRQKYATITMPLEVSPRPVGISNHAQTEKRRICPIRNHRVWYKIRLFLLVRDRSFITSPRGGGGGGGGGFLNYLKIEICTPCKKMWTKK